MKPTLVVSKDMRPGILKTLDNYYSFLLLEENADLPAPVATHPDMQLLVIDKSVIVSKSLFEKNSSLIGSLNSRFSVKAAENYQTCIYPGDVSLNALYLENNLFCRTNSLDPAVKQICKEKAISIVDVRQGYAKCSTLAFGNAVITADRGIAKKTAELGYDTLLIVPGSIILEGYDYGFIGGASFCDENRVFFFGDITSHPDGERILEFIHSHYAEAVICDNEALTDFGGAIVI